MYIDKSIISKYTAYFHDGSLIAIDYGKNDTELTLTMESAEVDPEDIKDNIPLAKEDRIKGKQSSNINRIRDKTDRAIDQKWKHLNRLGCSIDFPVRPKGIRGKTFKKLCEKINNYNDLSYARFFGYHKYI